MSTAIQFFKSTKKQMLDFSWIKRTLLIIAVLAFLASSFLFLTSPGTTLRIWMAETVIITQHREWAWIFVGAEQRDEMVRNMHQNIEKNAEEKQDMGRIQHKVYKKNRSIDELIKVEDISGPLWKGKRMYVFDPKSIRAMTPVKSGEGERISAMVKRTGAVAGVNAGGFDDPEGLGNGFAALGVIVSGGEVIFTDQDETTPQHIVGFTKDGTLIIGKYSMTELRTMGISEAASFYPRVIANGKPLPISDGSRAPRTAVGQKEDGTVIFIVVDGRQAHSVGATLKEIQELFLADDVVNAGFLDGGASSELVVNGELVTKPSSRYGERRLPSAFLVYDHPEEAVANRVWDGINKIDAGGSYDHPDFLREQAEIKARQKNNPTPATPPATPTAPTTVNKPETDKTEKTDKPKSTEPGNGSGNGTNAGTGNGNGSVKPNDHTKPPVTEGKETDPTKNPPSTSSGNKESTTPAAPTTPGSTPSGSTGTETGKPAGGTTGNNGTTVPTGTTPQGGNPAGSGTPAAPTTPTTPVPKDTAPNSTTTQSTGSSTNVNPPAQVTPSTPAVPTTPVNKPN
ncbi:MULTISPECIES: phosphodiester glycosidase family protein [unclassified Paenibacillus]|uniref:phosphodiester glycosidase family protein n=1 Tax=unclassified Paenibacillus TaxID=185978 RepID=UPI0036412FCB